MYMQWYGRDLDANLIVNLTLAHSGAGSDPEWNETFIFTVSDDTPQLSLKIMDSDVTNDDFVGEAR
jgi:Ca2+-dependent lipid-binding protein